MGTINPVNPAPAIELSAAAVVLPDRETVETLSFDDSRGTSYIKLVLLDMDTDRSLVYLQNTERIRPHRDLLDAAGLDRATPGLIRGSIIYDPELVAADGSLEGVFQFTDIELTS